MSRFSCFVKTLAGKKNKAIVRRKMNKEISIHCVRRAMQDNAAIGSLGILVLHNASASLKVDLGPVVA